MRSPHPNFMRQLMFSFILFFTVAFVWTLIAYGMTESLLREEVESNSTAALEQLGSVLDSQLDEAFAAMRAFENDERCRDLLGDKTPEIDVPGGYQRRQLRQMLQLSRRPLYSDLFLYIPGCDHIISAANGACSFDIYCKDFYRKDRRTYADWTGLLSGYHRDTITTLRQDDRDTLMLLVSLPTNALKRTKAAIGCIIDINLLTDQLNKACRQEGAVLLLDGAGQLLACSDNAPQTDLLPLVYSDSCAIGGVSYMVDHVASSHDFQYISLLPTDAFWRQLNKLRAVMLTGMLVYLAVSCALAFLLTRRAYQPVSSLVDAVSRQAGRAWDKKSENELSFIGSAFASTLTDMRAMSRQLDDCRGLLKRRFLFERLTGLPCSDPWRDAFEKQDIHLLSDRFLVALVRMESTDPPFDLAAQLEGMSCERWRVDALEVSSFVTALLINLAPDEDETAGAHLASSVRHLISRLFAQVCTVSVSTECVGCDELRARYEEAQSLMEYRLIDGAGSSLLPDRVRHEETISPTLLQQVENILRAAFADQSGSNAPDLLYQALFDRFFERHDITLNGARTFMSITSSLLIDMSRSALAARFSEIQSFGDALLCADTLPTFRLAFTAFCSEMNALTDGTRHVSTLADEVVAYLEEHYADPTLGINTLGERFHLSPAYLSQQFKRYRGESLIDCLTAIRLRHAADLLTQTDMSIDSIAEAVGIPSNTSFNRAFKKAYATTPGVYRRSLP